MKFPIKQFFWAAIGGILSGLLYKKSDLNFLLSSTIVLCGILVADFLVHTWRMHKFTIAVAKDFDKVKEFVKSQGNDLMIGTRQELIAIFGVAYKMYDNNLVHPNYDHFCMINSQTEKTIMSKYNLSQTRSSIYRVFEFLF